MTASVPNSRCLQILRQLSERKESQHGRTTVEGPTIGAWPQTARKALFAEDDRSCPLQTVPLLCKEGRYIAEETPALPQEICPSWDDPPRQGHSQQHLDQIDAIFTELEDYLIDSRGKLSAKMKEELSRGSSKEETRLRCDQQMRDMRSLLHYFKQVTKEFLHPSSKPIPT